MATPRVLLVALIGLVLVAEVRAQVIFDTFDDGDVSDVGTFSATGGGIGVGTTDGADGTPDAALSVGLNPAETGDFAGFVITGGDGSTDISDAAYLAFQFRPTTVQESNLPLILEINLHEDANGNGAYDGGVDDEFQAVYRVSTGMDYTEVFIPLAAFADDNAVFPGSNDGFDFTQLLEIVVAIATPQGPEFAFAMDDVGFTSAVSVAVEEQPEVPGVYALGPAYPNPFNEQAQFDVTVEAPQRVRIEVYDLLGRSVAVLHDGLLPGHTRQTFTIDGRSLPSGTYLYRVTGETFSASRRIVLLK